MLRYYTTARVRRVARNVVTSVGDHTPPFILALAAENPTYPASSAYLSLRDAPHNRR